MTELTPKDYKIIYFVTLAGFFLMEMMLVAQINVQTDLIKAMDEKNVDLTWKVGNLEQRSGNDFDTIRAYDRILDALFTAKCTPSDHPLSAGDLMAAASDCAASK